MKYPLTYLRFCFEDVRLLYRQEQHYFANIAHHLTAKAYWPSTFEGQNANLLLKIFSESTSAGLEIQNISRIDKFKTQSAEFISIIVDIRKIFNVNTSQKGIRLKDEF